MIAAAEAPADFGQRARRELLGEIHADLARHHDRAGAARRQEVGARPHCSGGPMTLRMSSILTRHWSGLGDMSRKHHGGEIEGHGAWVELLMGDHPVERAFELAAAARAPCWR